MREHPPFEIPCPHARKGAIPSLTYADHHPLTTKELRDVLQYAADNRDSFRQAKAQCRLIQAISGMTCPEPDKGPVAEATHKLNKVFVEWVKGSEPPDAVIDQIKELIVISD